jgi:hypothetical protein
MQNSRNVASWASLCRPGTFPRRDLVGLVSEQDAAAEQVGVSAFVHLSLSILMRLTRLSTAPELQRRVSPLVTASWSARRPVTKVRTAAHTGGEPAPTPSRSPGTADTTIALSQSQIRPSLTEVLDERGSVTWSHRSATWRTVRRSRAR